MSVGWSEASQSVIHTAEIIVKKYHPDLQRARIGFIFRSEAGSSGGRYVLGHAKKVSYQDQTLMEYDFVIWLAKDEYEKMSDHAREALIDHELCHCTMPEGEAKTRPHDIEEFQEIIERYGLWKSDLVRIAPAFEKAMQLDFGLKDSDKEVQAGFVSAISPDVKVSFD